MIADWHEQRCICCLGADEPMTVAHVIADSVGGRLAARFLCGPCNNRLGGSVEAALKGDPRLRLAIEALTENDFARNMRNGQPFVARVDDVVIRARSNRSGYEIRDSLQPDGSLVKSTERARKDIATTLRRRGASLEEIEQAVSAHDRAGEGELVRPADGLAVRKGSATRFDPVLSAPLVDPRCPLAMAYLFLGLLLGRTIYDPVLEPVREALDDGPSTDSWHVESLRAGRSYEAWHGLTVEMVEPYVTVQIRLFGHIAWRVHFAAISIPRAASAMYRVDLKNGQEHWSPVGGRV